MQVPEITSSTDYLSASSLLSAFALLSSASDGTSRQRRAAPGRKTGIFRMVQNILEVPVTSDSTLKVPLFLFTHPLPFQVPVLFCPCFLILFCFVLPLWMPPTVIFYGTCTSFLSFFPANCHLAVKHLPLPVICLKKSSSADRTF